ncbi:hypothetical protein Goari_023118 [Gossypium aridum]|uniref:Reticulon-like protein n=1 Tax=Gossypium aridum TaxID=34290 RepID=A0A7J8X252_GOSAI|nr:hypothetical protein [Gossypium aridum]
MVSYVVILSEYIHDKLGYRMYKYSVSPHYIVQLASRNRTFDCSAAQKHLGYSLIVSLEDEWNLVELGILIALLNLKAGGIFEAKEWLLGLEFLDGIKSTVASFSHLSKDSSFMRFGNFDEQSKAEKLLGSGIVADVLLWRDERRTFMCFLILALAFYWFFFCGKTFTSSAAQLLLLVTAILYGYGILASDICGSAVQNIPSSCFEIQNSDVKNSIRFISYMWNRVVCSIRLLAKGEDWSRFFKVMAFLYLFKWIVSYSLAVLVGIVLAFAFTAFFIYEQYESVIEGLWAVLLFGIMESKGLITSTLPDSVTAFLRNNNGSHQEKAHFS